jgi:hypothetical protein
MTKPTRKLTREERELQALLKKMKKLPKKIPASGRYIDPNIRRDDEGLDEATEIFQEMKRRDF